MDIYSTPAQKLVSRKISAICDERSLICGLIAVKVVNGF
jgi:hypothetical protein